MLNFSPDWCRRLVAFLCKDFNFWILIIQPSFGLKRKDLQMGSIISFASLFLMTPGEKNSWLNVDLFVLFNHCGKNVRTKTSYLLSFLDKINYRKMLKKVYYFGKTDLFLLHYTQYFGRGLLCFADC